MTPIRETGLWIVPDPWKTRRRVSHRSLDGAPRRPQRSTGALIVSVHDEKASKMTSQMEGAPGMR